MGTKIHKWKMVKLSNRRILMRRTRSGLIKILFKRLDESGEGVMVTPLMLSPLSMDALCSAWFKYRGALNPEED